MHSSNTEEASSSATASSFSRRSSEAWHPPFSHRLQCLPPVWTRRRIALVEKEEQEELRDQDDSNDHAWRLRRSTTHFFLLDSLIASTTICVHDLHGCCRPLFARQQQGTSNF
nr:uncharacterized protein LOC127318759 isoform X2 [Lolium perenne]